MRTKLISKRANPQLSVSLMLLGLIGLTSVVSGFGQAAPLSPGATAQFIASTGGTNGWMFSHAGTTTPDILGGQSLVQTPGTLVPSAIPGTVSGTETFLEPNTGFFATPGNNFNAAAATADAYSLTSSNYQTFGDGKPHSLVFLFNINTNTYAVTGSQLQSWTPLRKAGEYELQVNAANGGSINLFYGSQLQNKLSASAYPELDNRFLDHAGESTNLAEGWYMVTISYDGSSQLCLAINDAPRNCVNGVSFATSPGRLQILGPVSVESLFAYQTVIESSQDPGATCGALGTSIPCARDLLYNYDLAGGLLSASGKPPTILQINGGNCVATRGWGNTYTTYQSPTIPQPTYQVYNPGATCTVTTNAPSIVFNLVALNGQSQFAAQNAHIGVWVDGAFWGIVQAQQTGGQLVVEALPGDGATHSVEFNISGYVGYSGLNTTPYAGMSALVVNDIRINGGYSLAQVMPVYPASLLVNGDSISIGDQANWIETDGIFQRLKSDYGAVYGSITLNSVGGDSLWYRLGCNPGVAGASGMTCTATKWANGSASNPNAMTPAAYAAQLKSWYGCPTYFWQESSVNDKIKNLWKAADAEIAMSYFWSAWSSICPSTLSGQQSPFYNKTAALPNASGDYLVSYDLSGKALSPSWQADLAAACTPANHCLNLDASGTSASGTSANTYGFPVYGDATYGTCAKSVGGPEVANNAYNADGLHFTSCGYEMAYHGSVALIQSLVAAGFR